MRSFLAALVLCFRDGAHAVPTALGLSALLVSGTVWATPYRGEWPKMPWEPRVRIVYACPQGYVCFPAKDEARMESGLQLANLLPQPRVKTIPFRASDYPPAQQAAENRKRKSAKR